MKQINLNLASMLDTKMSGKVSFNVWMYSLRVLWTLKDPWEVRSQLLKVLCEAA